MQTLFFSHPHFSFSHAATIGDKLLRSGGGTVETISFDLSSVQVVQCLLKANTEQWSICATRLCSEKKSRLPPAPVFCLVL